MTNHNDITSYIVMITEYIKQLPPHWEPIATVFSALGDSTRQKILLLFEPNEELSIKLIAEQLGIGRTTLVHHLAVLEKSGVMVVRRQGREALYSVNRALVLDALDKLRLYIVEEDAIAKEKENQNEK